MQGEEAAFVVFPYANVTAVSVIGACESLIIQLEKKDPNEAVTVIWGDGHRVSVQVRKSSSHCNEVGHVSQQDTERVVWRIAKETSVGDVVRCLKQLAVSLFAWVVNAAPIRDSVHVALSCNGMEFSIQQIQKQVQNHMRYSRKGTEKKLLLIDGSNLLSRAYYATSKKGESQLRRGPSGLYTNAVYVMTQQFLNLLREHQPTHVAVCWDIDRQTFRRELYPGYKANRDEYPLAMREQFGTMQKLLHRMGIKVFGVKGYEADDLIGTIARRWQEVESGPCLIVSSDKDLYQLLSLGVTIVKPGRKDTPDYLYNLSKFEDEYGISPHQWVDVKAILGESGPTGDGIPGIKGCGVKAAIPLIQRFGSLEGVYESLDKLPKELIRYVKMLAQGKDDAFLSRQLAKIVSDVPNLSELSCADLTLQINEEAMRHDFKTLGLNKLLHGIDGVA